MPEPSLVLLGLVIVAALAFDFINGFHDTANAIATCISTRALSIRNAIVMAAGLNFVGALVSTHVAATIGKGIVDPANVTQTVVLAALAGAIFWDLLTWHYGIPASSSHAIIGGIIGAVGAARGFGVLNGAGIAKILAAIVLLSAGFAPFALRVPVERNDDSMVSRGGAERRADSDFRRNFDGEETLLTVIPFPHSTARPSPNIALPWPTGSLPCTVTAHLR